MKSALRRHNKKNKLKRKAERAALRADRKAHNDFIVDDVELEVLETKADEKRRLDSYEKTLASRSEPADNGSAERGWDQKLHNPADERAKVSKLKNAKALERMLKFYESNATPKEKADAKAAQDALDPGEQLRAQMEAIYGKAAEKKAKLAKAAEKKATPDKPAQVNMLVPRRKKKKLK